MNIPDFIAAKGGSTRRTMVPGLLLAGLVSGSCNWTQNPAAPSSPAPAARRSYVPIILATPTPAPKPTPTPTATPAAPAPAPSEPTPNPNPKPPAPSPEPEPEPDKPSDSNACPTPGLIRIKVHYPNGPNGWVIDSVALTCDKKYCAGYKMPDGSSRNCCPLGPEGSNQRVRCEEEMVPDGPSWQMQGGSHQNHPTNPWLHFVRPPAAVRACLKDYGVCSDWLKVSGK